MDIQTAQDIRAWITSPTREPVTIGGNMLVQIPASDRFDYVYTLCSYQDDYKQLFEPADTGATYYGKTVLMPLFIWDREAAYAYDVRHYNYISASAIEVLGCEGVPNYEVATERVHSDLLERIQHGVKESEYTKPVDEVAGWYISRYVKYGGNYGEWFYAEIGSEVREMLTKCAPTDRDILDAIQDPVSYAKRAADEWAQSEKYCAILSNSVKMFNAFTAFDKGEGGINPHELKIALSCWQAIQSLPETVKTVWVTSREPESGDIRKDKVKLESLKDGLEYHEINAIFAGYTSYLWYRGYSFESLQAISYGRKTIWTAD